MKYVYIALLALVVGVLAGYSGSSWEGKTRQQKMAALWSSITSNKNAGSFPSTVGLAGLFLESMDTTFDTVADQMPKQGLFDMFTRKKLIHSVGGIGKCHFSSAGGHPYTGLFKGADSMFCRLSFAKKPDNSVQKRVAPGMALKWLRDGRKSANFMAMYALDGQHSYDFFENDLSSNVPFPPKSALNFALKSLLTKFETASPWPTMLGLSDVARYTQDGSSEASPVFPWRLQFHPTSQVQGVLDANPNGKSIAENLKAIPTGAMYKVFAQSQPDTTLQNKHMQYIGDLVLDTPMTPSKFADETLFFQHQRKDDDFKIIPSWESGAQTIKNYQANNAFTYPACTNMQTCA